MHVNITNQISENSKEIVMEKKQNQITDFLTPERLKELGVWQFGVVSTDQIPFSEEARKMCESNVCRNYGESWACPPAVGTVEE